MEDIQKFKKSETLDQNLDISFGDHKENIQHNHLYTIQESSSQQKSKCYAKMDQQKQVQKRPSLLQNIENCTQVLHKKQILNSLSKSIAAKLDGICLIHEKVLDIICLKDQNVICASCAIFGHKGHDFKSMKEFQQQKLRYCQKIVQTLSQREDLKQKIVSEQTISMVKTLLRNKKQQLTNALIKQYEEWFKLLKQSQNSSIQSINIHISSLENSVLDKLIIPSSLQNDYQEWHMFADKEIKVFQSLDVQKQLKLMNYTKKPKSYDVQANGESIIKKLQSLYDTVICNLQREVEATNLCLDTTLAQSLKKLSDKCIGTSRRGSLSSYCGGTMKSYPLSLHSSNWVETPVEDLLIQDSYPKIPKLIQLDQNRGIAPWDISEISPAVSRDKLISLPNQIDLDYCSAITSKATSPNKNSRYEIFRSQISSKQSIKSPRTLIYSIRSSTSRTPRTASQQNYDKLISEMIRSHSQVLDLSGALLGDLKIMKILQRLRCVKIRTAILSKNRLTDAFVQKIWSLLPYVQRVDLSGNLLSEKILNNMITTRRFQKSKSIKLSNNRIREKEIKFKLDALNRLGITIQF